MINYELRVVIRVLGLFRRVWVLSPNTNTRSLSPTCKTDRVSEKINTFGLLFRPGIWTLFVPGQKTLERRGGTPGGAEKVLRNVNC